MYNKLNKKNIIISIFFISLVIIGLLLHKDFGLTGDEPWLRELGIITTNYIGETLNLNVFKNPIANSLPALRDYPDGDHGPLFEILSIIIEKILNIEEERNIYIFKHLLTYLVALTGVYAMYAMAARRYKSWQMGLTAALLLVISPRFFAESFYNSKDIIFMALFAMAMNSMVNFIVKNSPKTAIIHAVVTAAAFDIRIAAIAFPILTVFFMVIQAIKKRYEIKDIVFNLAIYFFFVVLLVPLMWPWLWIDLLENIKLAFVNMAHFQRLIAWVLYRGHYYVTDALPWHYIPIYILITTPIIYILFFIIGAIRTLIQIAQNKIKIWKTEDEMQDFLFAGLFFGPIILIIIMKSALYNGWRHLYFVYPAFLMIALRGFVYIYNFENKKKYLKYTSLLLLIFGIVSTGLWMIKNHPMNNAYFNILAGKDWKRNFQVDYAGLSTYHALKYILANDKSERILIKPLQCININESMILLTKEERARIELVFDQTISNYMLLGYQFLDPSQDKLWYEISSQFINYHNIKVGDEIILSILKEKGLNNSNKSINEYGFKTC